MPPPGPARLIGRRADLIRKTSVAIGFVVLFAVFSALTSSFYQPANLIDIMLQSSINAVIAVGMTLVIMTKGIDLSVGSIAGLSSMIAAGSAGYGTAWGILAGLGRWPSLRLPERPHDRPPAAAGLHRDAWNSQRLPRRSAHLHRRTADLRLCPRRFERSSPDVLLDIPTPVLFALVIAVGAFLLVRFTALGEQIIAVGGNEEAARLSGVDVERVKI